MLTNRFPPLCYLENGRPIHQVTFQPWAGENKISHAKPSCLKKQLCTRAFPPSCNKNEIIFMVLPHKHTWLASKISRKIRDFPNWLVILHFWLFLLCENLIYKEMMYWIFCYTFAPRQALAERNSHYSRCQSDGEWTEFI